MGGRFCNTVTTGGRQKESINWLEGGIAENIIDSVWAGDSGHILCCMMEACHLPATGYKKARCGKILVYKENIL